MLLDSLGYLLVIYNLTVNVIIFQYFWFMIEYYGIQKRITL